MEPLQIHIGPTICIGQESWCLPYAGFFFKHWPRGKKVMKRRGLKLKNCCS